LNTVSHVEKTVETTGKNRGNVSMKKESRWINIKVPRALLAALDQFRKSPREPWWFIIAYLINLASGVQREFDRRFWYQFKVVNGWAMVKTAFEMQHRGLVDAAFVSSQKERFLETLREVRARVRSRAVDSAATTLASRLRDLDSPTGKDIAELNDLVKQLCMYILTISEGE